MKTSQYFEDKEEERIVGEEEYMNEPKGITGINWTPNRSEQSNRALEQLDHNINKNPLD